MEQKEQQVVTPKVTVTVEKDGKTARTEGKGIIGFVLRDDGVRVVLSYNCDFMDRLRLFDALCLISCDMLDKEPELREALLAIPAVNREIVKILPDEI